VGDLKGDFDGGANFPKPPGKSQQNTVCKRKAGGAAERGEAQNPADAGRFLGGEKRPRLQQSATATMTMRWKKGGGELSGPGTGGNQEVTSKGEGENELANQEKGKTEKAARTGARKRRFSDSDL